MEVKLGGACLALALLCTSARSDGTDVFLAPDEEGPTTDQKVEVYWEMPSIWSSAKVVSFDTFTGAHTVVYTYSTAGTDFNHTAELLPNRWSLLPSNTSNLEPASAPEPASGREKGAALVGETIRVLWDAFAMWHKGFVRQCDVRRGKLGSCTVEYVEGPRSGASEKLNFSDPKLRWRGEFVPDPERWALPPQAHFHAAPNMAEFDVDVALIERVRAWYERDVLPRLPQEGSHGSWTASALGENGEPSSWFSRYAGATFGSDIRWVSPDDLGTHQRMSRVYHQMGVGRQLRQHVDLTPNNTARDLRVYIPSFVVRSTVPKSYHHHDWKPEGGANGLTLMTPLYDMASATEGCNLLYKDADLKEHVYKYTLGKAVVFGGGTWHSSQPCKPRTPLERARPWAFLCFNFGTDKMEYWPTLQQNIVCSGKLIVQPDGNVAPEATCSTFTEKPKHLSTRKEEEGGGEEGEVARTLRAFRDAVRSAPNTAAHHFNLGSALLRHAPDSLGEAVRVLQRALELEPGNEDVEELLEEARDVRAPGVGEAEGGVGDSVGAEEPVGGGGGDGVDMRDDEGEEEDEGGREALERDDF